VLKSLLISGQCTGDRASPERPCRQGQYTITVVEVNGWNKWTARRVGS